MAIGDDVRTSSDIISTDPGRPDRAVAVSALATTGDVDAAVALGSGAQVDWGARPAQDRAETLQRAAEWMRARRPALTAAIVLECAKPWVEADADVCEAIDFLEYYARGAVALASATRLNAAAGERNTLQYAPCGVVAAIAPWNFPLAIPTGMVAAPLALGNSVVLKPAAQSPGVSLYILEALRAAGVPAGVFSLLPGGDETGKALVAHPGVDVVAFTGSSVVGVEIIRDAGESGRAASATRIKRVVAEMGGKNCMIIDSDADLDAVVPAVLTSAFSFGGQKCSATSRVIAHEAIADELLHLLTGGASGRYPSATRVTLETVVPALIDEAARDRVQRFCRRGSARRTSRAWRPGELPKCGWYVSPQLVYELESGSSILSEEIFGPILAFERVSTIEEACDRVDALPYALTGGLFSRNPTTIGRVVSRSPVGNLYINRPTTGAMVSRQPFGGNRRSGTGARAGGVDYLLQFADSRVVAENISGQGAVA